MDLAQRLGEGVPVFVKVNRVSREALGKSVVSIMDGNGEWKDEELTLRGGRILPRVRFMISI